MRLLLVFFCLLPLFLAEDVNFSIYFKGLSTVTEVGEKVKKLIGMINSDNQFVSANVDMVDCAEEENLEQKYCKDHTGSPIIRVIGGSDTPLEVHGVIDKEDPKIFKQIQRIFIKFCTAMFLARSDGGQKDGWWDNLPSDLSEKISKYMLSSQEELENFKETNSAKHSLLVCHRSDDFEDLAAVFTAIQATEKMKAPLALSSDEVAGDICCGKEKKSPRIVDLYGKAVYQTYDGEIEAEKLADFIRTLRAPIITELYEEIVPSFRSGLLTDFPERRETTFMLFSPNRTNEPFRLFEKFSQENHGKYHMGTLVDDGVAMWPHQPALIVGKPYERVSKVIFNHEDLSENEIRRCIEEGLRPSIHYIQDVKTAEAAFSIARPILFFFDKTKKTDATSFAKLAADDKIRASRATFAVINGRNMFSLFLAEQLKVAEQQASFVLYHPDKKCVHVEQVDRQSEKELERWLKRKLEVECSENAMTIDHQLIEMNHLWERKQALLKQIHSPPIPSFHDEL